MIKNKLASTQNPFDDLHKHSTNLSNGHAIVTNPLVCPPLPSNSTQPKMTSSLHINTHATNEFASNSCTNNNIVCTRSNNHSNKNNIINDIINNNANNNEINNVINKNDDVNVN